MTNQFSQAFNSWHQKNDKKYESARAYHNALKNRFKDWHSPEYVQNIEDKYNIEKGKNESYKAEIDELKLQIQKKPVIPDYVAEVIKSKLGENYSLLNIMSISSQTTAFNRDDKYHRFYEWVRDNDELFSRAWLDGYTVEQEKKFYLKNIDLSEADKDIADWYLYKDNNLLSIGDVPKGELPDGEEFKFTQSEIDKLHGGYEQIEVGE